MYNFYIMKAVILPLAEKSRKTANDQGRLYRQSKGGGKLQLIRCVKTTSLVLNLGLSKLTTQ